MIQSEFKRFRGPLILSLALHILLILLFAYRFDAANPARQPEQPETIQAVAVDEAAVEAARRASRTIAPAAA
jgi:colicin import membrane protein